MLVALEAGARHFLSSVRQAFNALGSWVTYEMGYFGKLWASKYLRMEGLRSSEKLKNLVPVRFFLFSSFCWGPSSISYRLLQGTRLYFLSQ